MHVEEELDREVTALAGERYARKAASMESHRSGSNPGTVRVAGQRVQVRGPRTSAGCMRAGGAAATTPARFWAVTHDVLALVPLAQLDQRPVTEGFPDGRAEPLAPITSGPRQLQE